MIGGHPWHFLLSQLYYLIHHKSQVMLPPKYIYLKCVFISISIVTSSQDPAGLFHWCHKWSFYFHGVPLQSIMFSKKNDYVTVPLKICNGFPPHLDKIYNPPCGLQGCTQPNSSHTLASFQIFEHPNLFSDVLRLCSCDSLIPFSQL